MMDIANRVDELDCRCKKQVKIVTRLGNQAPLTTYRLNSSENLLAANIA